ncbi:hypothetical protein QQ045_021329 [Rhodiola kirilowii]
MMNSSSAPIANVTFTNSATLTLPDLSKALAFRVPVRAGAAFFQSCAVTVGTRIRAQTGRWGSQRNHAQFGDENMEKDDDDDDDDDDDEGLVEDLRVPEHWMIPSKAKEESEWLRVTLQKWLDDEYCPEETNNEISKVAAQSFYNSLLEKNIDIGGILLKMAKDLESINYQESFHGAFSSANAAIDLVMQRKEQESISS